MAYVSNLSQEFQIQIPNTILETPTNPTNSEFIFFCFSSYKSMFVLNLCENYKHMYTNVVNLFCKLATFIGQMTGSTSDFVVLDTFSHKLGVCLGAIYV